MTMDEVMEQVRSLLNDPLEVFVDAGITQLYTDEDILDRVPSALRYLRSIGVEIDALLSTDAELDPEPTERQGVLLASRVASDLLRGELTRRLLNGNLGMVFQMGSDLIDTKTAAIQFANASSDIEEEFEALLAIELSPETDVFGGPFAPGQ